MQYKGCHASLNMSLWKRTLYAGKTSQELKQRKAHHRCTIRCKEEIYEIAAHFMKVNHPLYIMELRG